jgi:hypothetical protein
MVVIVLCLADKRNLLNKRLNKDFKMKKYEIACLGIEAVAIYVAGIVLLGRPINWYMPNWFFGPAGLVLVLGFDVLWGVCIRLWRPTNERLHGFKKVLSVAVFALSASVLTSWLILRLFQNIW